MNRKRVAIAIEGIVQGVGFRPFVYQCARQAGLSGWVFNDSRGVRIEAEGEMDAVDAFVQRLRNEPPPLARISGFDLSEIDAEGEGEFVIRASDGRVAARAQVAPDTYVCPDCLRELFDPADRRYRYPFINCTNCGPRYTIVTGIPYDRPNTTMERFPMCPDCLAEYRDPASRRFHAQPNACPKCGPGLFFSDRDGRQAQGEEALERAQEQLRAGKILAVKGLGGYHLAVDAENDAAVAELRRRKARDEKPFALMSADLQRILTYARVEAGEEALLASAERPIVLLHQRPDHRLSAKVAPRNRYFGVMLPYTPLHYLLLEGHFVALVMTSANLSDEPICFEDGDARQRLGPIADGFLSHDRAIHIRTDDSIARVMAGEPLLLRRSRGYVPRALFLPESQPQVLAVGAELKNCVCLTQDDRAFLSHHVGDLKNAEVLASLELSVRHLKEILELEPQVVAHDLHPDYLSTRFALERTGLPAVAVQHHHAHLASCLAEHGETDAAIGVIFDGIGYGTDGRIWGGEFLIGDLAQYRRVGHFAYVPMPGGDAATREPLRMALAYLRHAYGGELPSLPLVEGIPANELRLYLQMMEKGLNSPLTSSCGRLFDAVSALVGLRERVSYEGQAALELEMAIEGDESGEYPVEVKLEEGLQILDFAPLIRALVADLQAGESVAAISARFHNGLARMVVKVCDLLRQDGSPETVALSGGVFQNRYLTEKTVSLLKEDGFRVLTHSLVPPNDGGLALGQAVIAARQYANISK